MARFVEGINKVRFNEPKLDFMLNNPSGTVGRHMRRVGLTIQILAKSTAGVRTGALRASIYMKHNRKGKYQYVEVGSPLSYAKDHHEGTRPHSIMATPGRVMRFNVGGRVVYAKKVNHPGTRGTRFLTGPMRTVVK